MKKVRSDVRIETEELTKQYIKSGGTITKCKPYQKSDEVQLINKKAQKIGKDRPG